MLQVIHHPNEPLHREVREFMARLGAARGACVEHDPRWLTVLREALRHRTMAIVDRAAAGAPLRGYLPLALVRSRLFGRFLVSLPYLNRAGILAEDAAAADRLMEKAVELADSFGVQYLELRHDQVDLEHQLITDTMDEKVAMVLDLPADTDAFWSQISGKVRNQVRKGDKHDLSIEWGGVELLDAFYDIFAENMRDLGTPVYPRKLFQAILTHFEGDAELACVRCEGEPAAAALLLHDDASGEKNTQVPSASCLRRFNRTCANMWMYHHLLCRAIERGSATFDFGRTSPDSGTYKFKKQWGAEPRPNCWQYHLRFGDLGGMRPSDPKMQKRIERWQKLPVWVTRIVGPQIVRGIP